MAARKAAPKKAAAKPAVETVSKDTQDIYLDPVLAAARDEQAAKEALNPLPPRTTEVSIDPALLKARDAEIKRK